MTFFSARATQLQHCTGFWDAFFANPRNYIFAEHTVDILQMMASMSKRRDDLAVCEALLAMGSRVLTHWELHSDAICALPLNADDSGNVPNLKPISRHRTSGSCHDTRYANNVRLFTDYETGSCNVFMITIRPIHTRSRRHFCAVWLTKCRIIDISFTKLLYYI